MKTPKKMRPSRRYQLNLFEDFAAVEIPKGDKGWTLAFHPSNGQKKFFIGRLDELYRKLSELRTAHGDFQAATIYRPTGAPHRKWTQDE